MLAHPHGALLAYGCGRLFRGGGCARRGYALESRKFVICCGHTSLEKSTGQSLGKKYRSIIIWSKVTSYYRCCSCLPSSRPLPTLVALAASGASRGAGPPRKAVLKGAAGRVRRRRRGHEVTHAVVDPAATHTPNSRNNDRCQRTSGHSSSSY